MPPKKKVGAPLKVLKPESKKDTEPELGLPPSRPKKIPKKPIFINGDFNNIKEVRKIRAKLWKVRSGTLPQYFMTPTDTFYNKNYGVEGFVKRLENPTIQKSLRHVKRLSTEALLLFTSKHFKKLCSSWKLSYLQLTFRKKIQNYNALKAFLNPRFRFCQLVFMNRDQVDSALLLAFQRVTKCHLYLYLNLMDETLSARVKIDQLRKLKKVKQTEDDSFLHNQAIIDASECFEATSFFCTDSRISHLPKLPDLQRFELLLQDLRKEESIEDVSFVKQYPELKALILRLGKREIENFDAIMDLAHLKEFHLYSRQWKARQDPPRILPDLTKLEKLTLSLYDHPIFDIEQVKEFINKNRGLKRLSLTLTVSDMAFILEEDEDFTLPEIETLQLDMVKLEKPTGGAKIIAETLRNHPAIKELILRLEQSNSNLNGILFKDGVARMKSLEKLTINFYKLAGGLEENKFKHLRNIFTNLIDLVELDLNLSQDVLPSKEISSILDWLDQLKNLKKLTLSAKCFKLTSAASNKLSNFIASLQHLKAKEINVQEV